MGFTQMQCVENAALCVFQRHFIFCFRTLGIDLFSETICPLIQIHAEAVKVTLYILEHSVKLNIVRFSFLIIGFLGFKTDCNAVCIRVIEGADILHFIL